MSDESRIIRELAFDYRAVVEEFLRERRDWEEHCEMPKPGQAILETELRSTNENHAINIAFDPYDIAIDSGDDDVTIQAWSTVSGTKFMKKVTGKELLSMSKEDRLKYFRAVFGQAFKVATS